MSAEGNVPRHDPWQTALAAILIPAGLYFLVQHAFLRLQMTRETSGDYDWARRFWLLAHTACGFAATLAGPLQFMRGLRARRPGLHRRMGAMQLLAVLTASTSACVLAFTSQIPVSHQWGLVMGASASLGTAAIAYAASLRSSVAQQRAWMVRNSTAPFFIAFFAIFDLFQCLGWTNVAACAAPLVFGCLLLPLAGAEITMRARRID